MKIKDLPDSSKPRERFLKHGKEALSDAELFAILLRTGYKGENVVEMSNRLIKEYGLNNLFDCSLKELQKIKGIGQSKAMQILTIAELSKRHSQTKNQIKKITCAKDVFDCFYDKLKDEKQEFFYVLLLNNQNLIIEKEFISKGILDSAILHPREVFRPAIKNSCSKIILVHNHPSGDANPSNEDLEITRQLIDTGKMIDIKVLDHVIIGNKSYWSWVENQN
jgi:DNA repair protein RadC